MIVKFSCLKFIVMHRNKSLQVDYHDYALEKYYLKWFLLKNDK